MVIFVLLLSGVFATQVGPAPCDVFERVPDEPDSSDYVGCLSVSQNGNPCTTWPGLFPHSYCRNPGGEHAHIWCWVDEAATSWEYCGVPTVSCGSQPCSFEQCQWPACDATGTVCEVVDRADGTPCDDGDEDTSDDTCTNGVCGGINSCAEAECNKVVKPCMRPADCVKASRNLSPNLLGLCVASPVRDETPCDDHDPTTTTDQCVSGRCLGSVPCDVPCSARTDCEVPVCENNRHCSYRNRDDGTPCNDGNPITINDQCTSGKCKGTCGGRNDACQAGGSEHFKLKLFDGHCGSDADCDVGLKCEKKCSTLAAHASVSSSWPVDVDKRHWDQNDKCCTKAEGDECRGETCEGRCAIGLEVGDAGCGCLCHPKCLEDSELFCCPGYEQHCSNFVPITNCTCRGNCGRYLRECGCSCAEDCGGLTTAPCCDDRPVVCETSCSCLGPTGHCIEGDKACNCRCDETCKRCHTFDLEKQNALGCQFCCSGVEKCEVRHHQFSCRGLCGHTAAYAACSCSRDCVRYGTCCPDIQESCGFAMGFEACTCEGRCNQTAECGHCSCDIECRRSNDCCPDVKLQCFPDVDIDLSRWSADEKEQRRIPQYRMGSTAQAESALTWQLLLVLVSIGVFVALFKQSKKRKA